MRHILVLGMTIIFSMAVAAELPKFKGETFGHYIKEFTLLETSKSSDGIPYSRGPVPFSVTADKQTGSRHLVLGCTLAGRQLGCLPGLLQIFNDFRNKSLGAHVDKLTIFIPNYLAGMKTAGTEEVSERREQAEEKLRVDQLKKLLDGKSESTLVIDVAQVIDPSEQAYYRLPLDELTYLWAQHLGAADTLVSPPLRVTDNSLALLEEAKRRQVVYLPIVFAQRDESEEAFKKQYEKFYQAIQIATDAIKSLPRTNDRVALAGLTKTKAHLRNFYKVTHQEPFPGPKAKLVDGLQNFKPVKRGELLGHNESNAEILSDRDGWLLNPKYPTRNEQGAAKKLPPFAYQILEKQSKEDISDYLRFDFQD